VVKYLSIYLEFIERLRPKHFTAKTGMLILSNSYVSRTVRNSFLGLYKQVWLENKEKLFE